MKFGILIPFRPQVQSNDWRKESYLLSMTIISALRQTYSSFHIYIIYTDMPSIIIHDSRVSYIYFEPGYKAYMEIEARDKLLDFFKDELWLLRNWDKGRRLTYGSMVAIQDGCDYLMALDADDRMSKYLFQRLAEPSTNILIPGWYMQSGYIMSEGSTILKKYNHSFHLINGSSHILHKNFIQIPDFSSQQWHDYNLFTDHGWIKDRFKKKYGVDLIPLTHTSIVYLLHSSNISSITSEIRKDIWGILKQILRSRPVTDNLRKEFFLID